MKTNRKKRLAQKLFELKFGDDELENVTRFVSVISLLSEEEALPVIELVRVMHIERMAQHEANLRLLRSMHKERIAEQEIHLRILRRAQAFFGGSDGAIDVPPKPPKRPKPKLALVKAPDDGPAAA